jgi:methionyl-tRNA synthetase
VLPEQQDTELSDAEIVRRVNEELVATWGNLVNRVMTLIAQDFEESVPEPGTIGDEDQAILDMASGLLDRVGDEIEAVELRAGLRTAMEAASSVNAYLNATEPWRLAKSDRERAATVLYTAVQAISAIRVALAPYLPFSADTLGATLGLGPVERWEAVEVPPGTSTGEPSPLFVKLTDDVLA